MGSCRHKVCAACFVFTWLVLLAGCGCYHYAMWLVLPGLQNFPQKVRAGWNDELGFARLEPELQQVGSSARTALAACGVVAEEQCFGREVVPNETKTETAVQKREIEMAFMRTLSSVQRVASDEYFGTEAFSPTASLLSTISANIALVSSGEQLCSESVIAYCALYKARNEALEHSVEVSVEVERLTSGRMIDFLESVSVALRCLHAVPYPAVLSMLLLSAWVRNPSALRKLCCLAFAVQWLMSLVFLLAGFAISIPGLWLLLEPEDAPLPLAGFPDMGSGTIWPSYLLPGRPPILPLCIHIRAEFPHLWDTLFGDMGHGPEMLMWATLAVQVSCLLMLFLGTFAKLCPAPNPPPSVADLVRDIGCDGAWPSAPAGELKELCELTPCQLKALCRVRRQCRALHLKALPLLLKRAKGLGCSEKDVERTLTWIRERAPIIIHIDLEAYGAVLAADTHYRNQFETNQSRGTLDHAKRSRWENELFRFAYNGAAAFERCKYGALNVVNDPQGVRSCRQYGLSYLLLRGVRLRTTFSATDSAGIGSEHLATVDYFAHVLNQFKDQELMCALAVGMQTVPGSDSGVLSSYKEAQIHGEIRLADHVALIMAHTSLHRAGTENALRALSERCQAEVIWIEGGIDRPPGFGPAVPLRTPSASFESSGRHASRAEPPTLSASPADEVWEAEGDDGWHPYEGAALIAIRTARVYGQKLARFEARGFKYEIDLEQGRQRNLTTGRWRRARRAR